MEVVFITGRAMPRSFLTRSPGSHVQSKCLAFSLNDLGSDANTHTVVPCRRFSSLRPAGAACELPTWRQHVMDLVLGLRETWAELAMAQDTCYQWRIERGAGVLGPYPRNSIEIRGKKEGEE